MITKKEAYETIKAGARTFYADREGLLVTNRNLSFALDKQFMSIYESLAEDVKERGKLWRLHVFLWAFHNGMNIEGDLVECGVYRGFSSAVAVRYTEFNKAKKRLLLFDTWDGIPEDQFDKGRDANLDTLKKYKDPANYIKTRERFENFENVELYRGRVPEVFSAVNLPEKISFLHLDMNTSIAEVGALEVLFSRVSTGAVILLDDFGLLLASEQMIAESNWFRARGFLVCELPTSQAIVIKR